jgi:hypothetical protein
MAIAPTYFLDATAVAARDAEYTGTPCTDVSGDGSYADPYLGCNRAGSNAPGIGINASPTEAASNGAVNANEWTVLDQHGAARAPQDGQHIGDTGLGAGDAGVGSVPINVWNPADMNNTCVLSDLAVGWVNTAVV